MLIVCLGGLHSLSSYGTVLLIAGGIGVTHPMSYLHEIMSRFSQKSTAVRKVSLIWVIRSIGEYARHRSKQPPLTFF